MAAINTRLANLEGRVAVLEAENQRFHVTGDVNIIGEATNSTHRSSTAFFEGGGNEQRLHPVH